MIRSTHTKEVEKQQEPEKKVEYKEKDGKMYRVVLESEDENSYINQFKKSFEAGLRGDNMVLSTGFPKLDQFMSIRKKVYYCIGASTGVGKTTFTDEAFVFNPAEWYLSLNNPEIDFKILYWSLERSMDEKIARWISRKIFLEHQTIITPDEILSRKLNYKLSPDKVKLVEKYLKFVELIMDKVLTVHAGSTNPNDIHKKVKEFAETRGTTEVVMIRKSNGYEYLKSVYVPHNPKEFVIIIVDPANRIRTETNQKEKKTLTKKEAMDKVSEHLLTARDKYGYTVIATCQFNRSISNPLRLTSENGCLPILDDFKETGNIAEDAEVVMTVFDPMSLKVEDVYGYSLPSLREGIDGKLPGNKKYRSLTILKNSYGPSDVGIGMAFQPQCGIFKQLKHAKDMTDKDYEEVLSDDYFIKY